MTVYPAHSQNALLRICECLISATAARDKSPLVMKDRRDKHQIIRNPMLQLGEKRRSALSKGIRNSRKFLCGIDGFVQSPDEQQNDHRNQKKDHESESIGEMIWFDSVCVRDEKRPDSQRGKQENPSADFNAAV